MKKILVLNHESYISLNQIKKYVLDVNNLMRRDYINIICPSNTYFPYFNGKYNFQLGSQDISPINITGEITGNVLKSNGVRYTLIGTQKRINYLNETPEMINEKIKEALQNNIIPIIVVGETFYNYELRKTGEVISKQIKQYLKDIEVEKDIIFVYEPNWEFKNKQIPNIEHITEVIDLIKDIIKRNCNINIKVLYSGNINIQNIKEIIKIKNIDGYIIEKSSTDLEELQQILNILE